MSRIEKLSSKEYRSSLRDYYFLEVSSTYARREASYQQLTDSNLEAVRKAKHILEGGGCVIGKWVELNSEFDIVWRIQPVIENGDHIRVRLRYVQAESEEAILNGDYVLISSFMMYACDKGAMTTVGFSAFEPITDFEKSFYIMGRKETLLKDLEMAKEEVDRLQSNIEKLDAKRMGQ
jgi:hypothetical protein